MLESLYGEVRDGETMVVFWRGSDDELDAEIAIPASKVRDLMALLDKEKADATQKG